jgi:DNA-binding HxlR family transcriptional regulator
MDTSNLKDTTHETGQCPSMNSIGKKECSVQLLPIQDALEVIGGKWKIFIIMVLIQGGKRRFKELQRELPGITGKVLSKELKDLEQHEIVTRTVFDTSPITVEYELTPYGHTLKQAIFALHQWGSSHRKRIMVK